MVAPVPRMPVRWGTDETVRADAVRPAVALDRPARDRAHLAPAHRTGGTPVTAECRRDGSIPGRAAGCRISR